MTPAPPRIVVWLLTRFVPADWRDSIAGDFEEERGHRASRGQGTGTAWAIAAAVRITAGLWMSRRRALHPRDRRDRSPLLAGIATDVRHAVRSLRMSPGYAAAAVATLALGLGANTAVFSLTNWLLLRPVPGIARQDQLVTLTFGTTSGATGAVSVPMLDRLAASTTALAGLAGYQDTSLHVATPNNPPRRMDAQVVSGNFFDVLGSPIESGRGFSPDEGRLTTAPAAVVVSDRFWREALGGSPAAVGSRLVINGDSWTVIGVAARGFHGPSRTASADLWVPIGQHARVLRGYGATLLTNTNARIFFGVIGRLGPGATADEVTTQAETVRAQLAAEQPKAFQLGRMHFIARPGVEARAWIRDTLTRSMTLLLAVVALLLVLTCANVGNLMLARATGRRHDIATRLAIGAPRRRVVRLVLIDSLVVSLGAGALAVGVAWVAMRGLAGVTLLATMRALDVVELDWRVFGFAFAASTVVAALAGVIPALWTMRVSVAGVMQDTGRSHAPARRRVRQSLAVVQVAVSLLLLVGGLLLARSMAARRSIDPGFQTDRVLEFSVELELQGYDETRQAAFFQTLLERIRARAGVRAAGLVMFAPFSNYRSDGWVRSADDPSRKVDTEYDNVSMGYFPALGVALLQGRDFNETDLPRSTTEAAVIVNASLARGLFGDAPAVGRRVIIGDPDGPVRIIVGVAKDVRQLRLLDPPTPMLFSLTRSPNFATVLVGVNGPAADVAASIREIVRDLDPSLPVYDMQMLSAMVDRQLADDTLVTRLTSIFAVLATLIAMVGVYGVLACGVADRRREIGIRVALGARPGAVAGLITREAMVVATIGVALGLGSAYWVSRFIESRLYGVTRLDATAFAGAVAIIAVATLLSAVAPARRAARIDAAAELK